MQETQRHAGTRLAIPPWTLDKTLSTPASLRGVQRRGQPALVPMTSASEWHRQDKTLSHSVYAGLAGWRAGVREKKIVHRRLHDAPIRLELLADATKPAPASRHATCYLIQISTRNVDANGSCYDWSNRGNYRTDGLRIPLFNVYRFCQD